MATLDDEEVRDLLFGDTDVRELTLFLAQQSLTMDAVGRDQRMTILQALNVHRTGELADQTKRIAALGTLAVAVATFIVAVTD